jgi:hypothetical protein
MTHREEIEQYLGVAKPAKVGKRTPTFTTNVAPSHWRKTLKALAKWMLIVVLASMAMGFIVGVFA